MYKSYLSSKHITADHQRPTRETPFECRFADGPMVALDAMLASYWLGAAGAPKRNI